MVSREFLMQKRERGGGGGSEPMLAKLVSDGIVLMVLEHARRIAT